MPPNSHATDAMIRRLENELEERNAFVQGLIANAEDGERDMNESELQSLSSAKARMGELQVQLEELGSAADLAGQIHKRAKQIDQALAGARRDGNAEVEYRSAGAYALEMYQAHLGNREAQERLEVFHRAAAHQKTGDNLGVIPDPVLGGVVNFIDAARPLVTAIGPQPMTSGTFHRPRVTQHTSVDAQGTAGAAGDEKAELVSQKMTITRLTANAVTYGGYVNVSRQNIDFSSPQIMDIIIDDLAAQYAIQTELATGVELTASTTTAIGYGVTPTAATVAAAVWEAAAGAYTAVKGQGRLILAVAPDTLGTFGPLFAPVNPQNAQSSGFTAGSFNQGVLGSISGIEVVMSAGLTTGQAFVFSTAAIEVFEQRVGTLQVTEPSVLGVQVAYAGYFTPLTIEEDAIIELTAS